MGKPAPVFMTPAHAQFTDEELRNLAIVIPVELTIDQLGMISGILMGEAQDESLPSTVRMHMLEVAFEMDSQVMAWADAHPDARTD